MDDLLISGGSVIDPVAGTTSIADVTVAGDRITDIGPARWHADCAAADGPAVEDHSVKWTARKIVQGDEVDRWRVESAGGFIDVPVAPGPGLLERLEEAVAQALGVSIPEPQEPARYRIDVSDYSHGDLFELERDTIWTVVDVLTGEPLKEFQGGTSHAFEGGMWSDSIGSHGVDEVVLGADGRHVLTRDSDVVACLPLPDS